MHKLSDPVPYAAYHSLCERIDNLENAVRFLVMAAQEGLPEGAVQVMTTEPETGAPRWTCAVTAARELLKVH